MRKHGKKHTSELNRKMIKFLTGNIATGTGGNDDLHGVPDLLRHLVVAVEVVAEQQHSRLRLRILRVILRIIRVQLINPS